MKCTKAIIPVAGYGTRRLPITKAIEKCMLPVLNRPVVDYIVQDCIAAGIKDFYFVVSEDCHQLRQYYMRSEKLEVYLKRSKKEYMLELIKPPEDCTFHFVVQPSTMPQYGTAVPVWLCRDIVEQGGKVLVIMGDQFIFNADGSSETSQFLENALAAQTDSAMLGIELTDDQLHNYGILATEDRSGVRYFTHIVEKPKLGEAPSNLMNASFYLFDNKFFTFLDRYLATERSDEHFITDPLNEYVGAGNSIAVISNKGDYLDCGTVEGWLHANEQVSHAYAGIA